MWYKILICFSFFFALNRPVTSPLFFHNVFILTGNGGYRILDIQKYPNSDDAASALYDIVDKYPLTFFIDTLTKDIFYNTYLTDERNVNTKNLFDFRKIRDAGKLMLNNSVLSIFKQPLFDKKSQMFFKHKVPLDKFRGNILLKLNDLTSKLYRDFFLDLNSDGLKEKIELRVKIDEDRKAERICVSQMKFKFYEKKNNVWRLYDEVVVSLENGEILETIDELLVFKVSASSNTNIYINSSAENKVGAQHQIQTLIMGSELNKSMKYTK